MTMKNILQSLVSGAPLSREQAGRAMALILSGEASPEQIAGFAIGLRLRAESVLEVTGLAAAARARALKVLVKRHDLVDTCGTGGDGADTFNISTAVAFVVAGAGVGVAKHGNRSVSSRCGSADVLEALGVSVELSPEQAARALDEIGFAFLFAPNFHPGFRHAAPVRKALGVRTVFNVLGPLVNPAPVRRQVLGVYDRRLARLLAEVLRELGSVEAMVVCGEDGLDEFTLSGTTFVTHLRDGEISESVVVPESLGLKRAPVGDLRGGDAAENARILTEILEGKATDAQRDVVLLNAAAALNVAGAALNLREGLELARASIAQGRALNALEKARSFR